MLLGRVIGTVVASKKDPALEGLKMLLVKVTDLTGKPTGSVIVAADAVGAGVGELVLYAAGSSARQTVETKDRPIDHVIMAIVDQVEADGVLTYDKANDG
ncbi:MAG: EutN/CcmL family microcompartment protein [Siculibacillus sp.]